MSILDLLVDNIFYVVIVIAFIFSMLGKMREKPHDAEQRPAGMPTFGGTPSLNDKSNSQRQERRSAYEQKRIHVQQITRPNKFEQQSIPSVYLTEPPVDSTSEQLLKTAADQLRPITNGLNFREKSRIKAPQIVQGVIWSEILSPPRAKRPYRK